MSFDSMDWIDDAVETLDRSDFPYFLLVAVTPEMSQTFSERLFPAGIGHDDEEAVIAAVREHFAQLRAAEEDGDFED